MYRLLALFLFSPFFILLISCGTPLPSKYSVGDLYQYERPHPEMAIIYIYHRKSHVHAPCYVWENDVKIGVIKQDTYFMRIVPPGTYRYLATNDSHIKSPVTVIVEQGKETFLEVRQESDFLAAHPYIDLVPPESARALLPGLKHIIYTP
ncbi:MAG TPA: hypothetical protein DCG53_07500 [Syntrophus sp. (in: bacteria)]|jgi:hypothetical protein|nr:hypothetical protein [Syntrophus sp. (in: bacteria)]